MVTDNSTLSGRTNCGCTAAEAVENDRRGTRKARYRVDNVDCPTEEAPVSVGMRARHARDRPTDSEALYRIDNMDCPTEEALIRERLGRLAGIQALEFNLMQRTLRVRHSLPAPEPIEDALSSIGMRVQRQGVEHTSTTLSRTNWWPLVLSGVAAALAEVVEWSGGSDAVVIALALLAILTGGLSTYRKGWVALRNRNLNINALMSIAVTGAMAIGHWPEAAMVMFLFALAEVIEAKSLDRARNAIRGLLDLTPESATIQAPDGTWREVPARSVEPGLLVRIKPGERIALDGEIVSGRSAVNQAPITGESLPVEKASGDKVFAGTVNESGSFEFRVTARAGDTTLARIIHAVESTQGRRAPTQRFVDRFARVYTPAVFAMALLVAVIPPLTFGGAWMDWIYRALVLLVVACPCALVISTPVTIVSGLAAAARRGILIKGGVYLEGGRKLAV
ncbi:MAG: heavy metal translocating P-type ATPase, partial [Burkholderiaceae bacterium]|nr:heavy metal translocating P-type ATPase [Burkholderiaceae bacterium]